MNLIINILSVYNHDFLDSFNWCCWSHILMVLSSCNIIKKFIRFKVHLMFVFWLLQLFLIISFHSFYFNEVKFILTSCNLQDLYKSFLSIYIYFLICLLKSTIYSVFCTFSNIFISFICFDDEFIINVSVFKHLFCVLQINMTLSQMLWICIIKYLLIFFSSVL